MASIERLVLIVRPVRYEQAQKWEKRDEHHILDTMAPEETLKVTTAFWPL